MLDDDPSRAPLKDNSKDADDVNPGEDWAAFTSSNTKEVDDVSSGEDSTESSEDEFVGSITTKPSNVKKLSSQMKNVQRGHISLKFTLAFCYLGLLWIDEPVFVSDLIRYVVVINKPR